MARLKPCPFEVSVGLRPRKPCPFEVSVGLRPRKPCPFEVSVGLRPRKPCPFEVVVGLRQRKGATLGMLLSRAGCEWTVTADGDGLSENWRVSEVNATRDPS
jgi:hypothetical protein